MKNITITELLELIPHEHKSQKYLSWAKLKLKDFDEFNLVGILDVNSENQKEFETSESYWSETYPIAINYYPNSGCEIFTDKEEYYLVYRDFGGHVPEKRCRLIRRELIIQD